MSSINNYQLIKDIDGNKNCNVFCQSLHADLSLYKNKTGRELLFPQGAIIFRSAKKPGLIWSLSECL